MDLDVLELRVERLAAGTCLVPYVNGVSLAELVAPVERAAVRAIGDGRRGPFGDFAGLFTDEVEPSRHYLGSPRLVADEGGTILMGCSCGAAGCTALSADVVMEPGLVHWRRFRDHRGTDLSALGPFVFASAAYEAAVRAHDRVAGSRRDADEPSSGES